MMSADMA